MPPKEWRLRIEDILEAIHKIRRYVSGLSFDDFCIQQNLPPIIEKLDKILASENE